jgi:hypothetical protein
MNLINEDAFDERVRKVIREEMQRPEFVHQRTVTLIVGLPRTTYLDLARRKVFPSTKERRLVLARTADVLAHFESRLGRRPSKPAHVPRTPEEIAFARVGARRVR